MIGTDLERLGLPHDETNLPSLLVLQKLHRSSASLLPLVSVLIEAIELRFSETNLKIKTHTQSQTIKTNQINPRVYGFHLHRDRINPRDRRLQ